MQPAQGLPNCPPITKNTSSAGATVPRRKPAAEEEFMELHPWANAQHPAHHQTLHPARQTLGIYRPDRPDKPYSPLSTPATQNQNADIIFPQGSASTVAEAHSGPNSSTIQNPATREQLARNAGPDRDLTSWDLNSVTSLKLVATPVEASVAQLGIQETDKAKPSQLGVKLRSRPSSTSRNAMQKNNIAVDKALSPSLATDSIDRPSGPNTLPPAANRFPMVKMEETLHASRQTPTIQYHHPAVPTNPALNGQVDRIGA